MEDQTIYRSAKKWQIYLYPMAAGVGNGFLMLMMYVSYIANAGYGIAVAVTGIIMTCTRIFDGITDPICAFISDRINTKHGKVRIMLVLGWAIMGLACWFMFVGGIGHGVVFFIIDYMVYIIGYTIYGIAQQIANPVITNNPKQRPLLSRWSTIYSMVCMLGLSMIASVALLPKFNNEYSIPMLQAMYYMVIGFTAVLVILACIAVTPIDKTEFFMVGKKREKPIGIKDCWEMLKGNRALQMFIIAAASDKLALQTAGNTAFMTLLAGVLIGNMGMSAILSALTMPVSIVAAILATSMASRRGNKKALVWWTWLSIISYAVSIVVYLFLDFTSVFKLAVPTIIFMVLQVVRACGQNGTSATTGAMLADIADYEASRTGNFMPGTVAATYSFVDKFISAFATTIAGFSLAFIGYNSVMPQPTDPATTSILVLVIVMTLGVPILGWLCTIVAMKWYPLTTEKMVEVQTKNHNLRESYKAESASAES